MNIALKTLLVATPLLLFLTGCPEGSQCSPSSTTECSPASAIIGTAPLGTPVLNHIFPGDTSVNLTWTQVASASSYNIFRSNVKVGSTSTTSFTDSNLLNGQTYTYCVVAINSNTQSAKSNCQSVTPMQQQVFAAGSILPIMWNFIFDSGNNLYSGNPTGGLLKTAPNGTTNVFFPGKSVLLITKDLADNIYLLVDSVGNFPVNGSNAGAISIQKISSAGNITTFCSSSDCSSIPIIQGVANGGGAVDSHGNLFVPLVGWAPYPNITSNTFAFGQIAKISALGIYSLFAGATVPAGDDRCVDGNSANVTFSGIGKMQIDSSDNIFIYDRGINQNVCNSVRKINPSGTVTTTYSFSGGSVGNPIWDGSGNLYFTQYGSSSIGSQIQKLSATGEVSAYCGGAPNPALATGNCSQVFFPQTGGNLTFDNSGNLYFLMATQGNLGTYPLYKVISH